MEEIALETGTNYSDVKKLSCFIYLSICMNVYISLLAQKQLIIWVTHVVYCRIDMGKVPRYRTEIATSMIPCRKIVS